MIIKKNLLGMLFNTDVFDLVLPSTWSATLDHPQAEFAFDEPVQVKYKKYIVFLLVTAYFSSD